MNLKLSILFLINLIVLNIVSASPAYQEARENFKLFQSHSKSFDLKSNCSTLTEISTKFKKILFEQSCTTDSDLDFMYCHQTSDSLTAQESKILQSAVSEIQSLNLEKCNPIEPAVLAVKIETIKNLLR